MNWLDVVLVILIGLSVLAGLKTGLVRSLLGLVAMVAGLICGLWFYGTAGSLFSTIVNSRRVANLIGFLVVFGIVIGLGALLGVLLERLLRLASLSWLDRTMGGVFGAVRGLLVAAAILLAVMAFAPRPAPPAVANSRIAPYALDTAYAIAAAAPYEVKRAFRDSYDKVKEIWADALKRRTRRLPQQDI